MKFIILLAFTLGMIASSSAQAHIEDKEIIRAKHFANSAGDSVSGTLYTISWNGLFPDSIMVDFVGQDTCRGKIYFKAQYAGSELLSRDSVGVIGSNDLFGTVLVARSLYLGKDQFSVAYLANGSGNGVTTGNNKTWVRVRRYFTYP